MKKNIIILGGFSNSGKTTSLGILEEFGWTVASTSKLLHTFTQNIVRSLTGEEINTYDRTATFRGMTTRQLNIHIAEEQLVPVFGRAIFAASVVESICNGSSDRYVIESFGGDEFKMLDKYLYASDLYFTCVNLRNSAENPEADKRTLLPTVNAIYNNGTIVDLKAEWLKFIVSV